jgi:hypothetical protein
VQLTKNKGIPRDQSEGQATMGPNGVRDGEDLGGQLGYSLVMGVAGREMIGNVACGIKFVNDTSEEGLRWLFCSILWMGQKNVNFLTIIQASTAIVNFERVGAILLSNERALEIHINGFRRHLNRSLLSKSPQIETNFPNIHFFTRDFQFQLFDVFQTRTLLRS